MSDDNLTTTQPPKLGLNRIEAAKAIGVSPATLDRLGFKTFRRPPLTFPTN
jgi:hypothetical protein